jgi:hypothetical protein
MSGEKRENTIRTRRPMRVNGILRKPAEPGEQLAERISLMSVGCDASNDFRISRLYRTQCTP